MSGYLRDKLTAVAFEHMTGLKAPKPEYGPVSGRQEDRAYASWLVRWQACIDAMLYAVDYVLLRNGK